MLRKLISLKILAVVIFTSFFTQLQGQRVKARLNGDKRGGGDPCQICLDPNNWLPNLILEFEPTQFPFKVKNISLNSPSTSNQTPHNPTNPLGSSKFCNSFKFYDIRIVSTTGIINNQTIFPNSSLINSTGKILYAISLKSQFCSNFQAKSNIYLCSSYNAILEYDSYDIGGKLISTSSTRTILKDLDKEFNCLFNSKSSSSSEQNKLKDNFSKKKTGLTIYPNPCKDVLNIEFDSPISLNSKIFIFDYTGRRYELKQDQISKIDTNRLSITLENLPMGPYILEAYLSGNIEIIRFIKSND